MYNPIIRWIIYLAGKDDDLVDDSTSLVLKELLNDVTTNVTCPSDGEMARNVPVYNAEWDPFDKDVDNSCERARKKSSFGAEY